MTELEKLLEIMAALRNRETGCPWDLEQDFSSVAPYTIEEAYEVADAIEREDLADLQGELGDLLFQVVFHSQMASEAGAFTFEDVVRSINQKMIRRHPHVFGSAEERAAGPVEGSWEAIKASERRADKATAVSALDGVAVALPALKRAEKLGKRAARVGFDWPSSDGVRAKVDEELAELEAADSPAEVEEELGDLLFSVANLARHYGVDPESALARANAKFEQRFRLLEGQLEAAGRQPGEASLDELEAAWQQAKQALDRDA